MLETLLFAFEVTGPIVVAISLGLILKTVGLLTDRFIRWGSALVFYVSLPLLMFTSVLRQPFAEAFKLDLVVFGVVITLAAYFLGHYLVNRASASATTSTSNVSESVGRLEQRAVVVQACFRGNLGIVGLSLCLNAYGTEILADVSVLMAMLTILYNVLSVWLFVRAKGEPGGIGLLSISLQMLKNPLITSILAGLLVGSLWTPDTELIRVTDTFVAWTLPVALICIGGSLTLSGARESQRILVSASTVKLIVMPLIALLLALSCGLPAHEVGMLFLLSSSPVAAASYVMARAYCSDASDSVPLAANLIVVTTLLSMLTVTVGVFVLRSLHII